MAVNANVDLGSIFQWLYGRQKAPDENPYGPLVNKEQLSPGDIPYDIGSKYGVTDPERFRQLPYLPKGNAGKLANAKLLGEKYLDTERQKASLAQALAVGEQGGNISKELANLQHILGLETLGKQNEFEIGREGRRETRDIAAENRGETRGIAAENRAEGRDTKRLNLISDLDLKKLNLSNNFDVQRANLIANLQEASKESENKKLGTGVQELLRSQALGRGYPIEQITPEVYALLVKHSGELFPFLKGTSEIPLRNQVTGAEQNRDIVRAQSEVTNLKDILSRPEDITRLNKAKLIEMENRARTSAYIPDNQFQIGEKGPELFLQGPGINEEPIYHDVFDPTTGKLLMHEPKGMRRTTTPGRVQSLKPVGKINLGGNSQQGNAPYFNPQAIQDLVGTGLINPTQAVSNAKELPGKTAPVNATGQGQNIELPQDNAFGIPRLQDISFKKIAESLIPYPMRGNPVKRSITPQSPQFNLEDIPPELLQELLRLREHNPNY